MKVIRVAVVAIGVLVIAAAIVAAYGIPARGLIKSYAGNALAADELKLDIAGDARVVLFPTPRLTIGQLQVRDAASGDDVVTIERVQARFSLIDLLTGRINIQDLALTRPVVDTDPMNRRARHAAEQRDRGAAAVRGPVIPIILPVDSTVKIDVVSVENGAVLIRDRGETVALPLDSVRIASMPVAGGRSALRLDARLGAATVRLTAGIDRSSPPAEGEAIPIDVTIDAPSTLKTPATLTASVTKAGPSLRIDGINGAIDQGRVRGSISVSFAGAKPFIDAAIQSERIDLTPLIDRISAASGSRPTPDHRRASGSPAQGSSAPTRAAIQPGASGGVAGTDRGGQLLSDAPLDFFGLRLFEGNLKLSARELLIRNLRIAPAAIETTLLQDTLTAKLSPSGIYGGQATGEFVVDVAQNEPRVGMQVAFSELDALPFLRDAFAFPYIAGRARGALDLKGAGASELQIVSSLTGRAEFLFENGAVRGLNLPNMVRSLLDMILAGWQPKASDETRFSTFAAAFAIENGVARSTDVKFTGPFMAMTAAGSADLRDQTLDFRADPRLISSPIAPAGSSGAWGIGVPVVIQGPWWGPRIYADTPNILAEPDRALRALRNALSGGNGGGQADGDAPLGKFIEGFSKQIGKAIGDSGREGGALADKMLDALNRGGAAPQPETTIPDAAPSSPQMATPHATPAPDQDLERGAREFLRDLLGR